MITSKYVRENLERFKKSCHNRFDKVDFKLYEQLEEERLELTKKSEDKRALVNQLSKSFAKISDAAQREVARKDLQQKSQEAKNLKETLNTINKKLQSFIDHLPCILDDDVPIGKSEEENEVVKVSGTPRKFDFKVLPHYELVGEDQLDFKRATKVSGARFTISKRSIAKLERALANFFLDENISRGYTEVSPPSIVNTASMHGTGKLPKFASDMFAIANSDFFLIPTSEIPLAYLHAEETIHEDDLPHHLTAATKCYRQEAGSAGKDTKGLMRVHEFQKVELVKITLPEQSDEALDQMVADSENLLEKLQLPYRRVILCSSDTGFAASKCYDLEVWIPTENQYREVSSCSNCRDFQARRSSIRVRRSDGSLDYAHTLNGSSLPTGRIMIAILENHQQADGSVRLPKILAPYMGTDTLSFR